MPSPSQVRVIDPILSRVAQGYRNAELVGYSLFPSVPVTASGGQIIEFGKEDFVIEDTQRAPGGGVITVEYGHLGRPYALENHAASGVVPREHLRDAQAVPGIDLGSRAVRRTLKKMLLGLEKQQADLARNASNYASTNKVNVAAAPWTDKTNGNPTADIETAKNAIRGQVGVMPTTVLLSAKAFAAARAHPLLIDRFKFTGRDSITADMLAAIWDVQSVKVGGAVLSTAGTLSDIWGGDVVVAFVPMTVDGMEMPSYGYTYEMEGHPMVEEPWYMDARKSWLYPVTHERIPVLSGISSGYLIQNAA